MPKKPANTLRAERLKLALTSGVAPAILVFLAAGLWGLYWLPLRSIETVGVSGLWAVFAVHITPLIVVAPIAVLRRRQLARHGPQILIIGTLTGAGLAFYATAFLYTSIMRTTLLFYLTPVWATLLAIVLLGEKPGHRRWLAIAVGLIGLVLMLGAGSAPATAADTSINAGDIAALLAGISWGAGVVMIRRSPEIESLDIVPAQFLAASLIALVLIGVMFVGGYSTGHSLPPISAWQAALPWLLGFYVLVMLPTLYTCNWGARIMSPGRVGILMMSEVLVAGISAPLLAAETLSVLEWSAAALILLAAVLEISAGGD